MFHQTCSRVLVASLALTTLLSGCIHLKPAARPVVAAPAPPPPPPPPPLPPPAPKAKLVVLPLEKFALPGTAEELNVKMARVKLPGTEDASTAITSMETAVLQSECSDPTVECYLKIARLVGANRILWAEVEAAGKGKRKKKNLNHIRVVLFDADKPAVMGSAEESFTGPISSDALDKLVAKATDSAGTAVDAVPAAALPPPAASRASLPPGPAQPARATTSPAYAAPATAAAPAPRTPAPVAPPAAPVARPQ